MQFDLEGAWDLATTVILAFALYFAYGLYVAFKGGKLQRAQAAFMGGLAILLTAFVFRTLFDLAGVDPVNVYGISVRDLGIVFGALFLCWSAWELGRFWRSGWPSHQ
ncbi:MAG: hypothetical protein JRM80_06125 [Nitrososphaerota archaeon]|nr:hypothetical protein [Nitrososphaerota archaeon]